MALSSQKAPPERIQTEVTYRFRVANDAPALGNRKVFVHFVDAGRRLATVRGAVHDMTTVSGNRARRLSVHGRCSFRSIHPSDRQGLLASTTATTERLKLKLAPNLRRSGVRVADFELLPQTKTCS